jgi:hypothetical protein
MNSPRKLWLILPYSLFLCGCGIFGGHNLAKRFRNVKNSTLYSPAITPQTFVQVDVHTYLIKEAKPPELKYNVLSLTREGQAQYIKTLGEKYNAGKDFTKQINTNFGFNKKPDETTRIISKSVKKSIIFTIGHLEYQTLTTGSTVYNLPGDRVSSLNLRMTISDNMPGKFDSWDKFVSDHLTLNLGKVSSAQQWSANVSVAAQVNLQSSLSGSTTNNGLDTTNQIVVTSLPDAAGNTNTTTGTNSLSNSSTNGTGSTKGVQFGPSAGLAYSDTYNTSLDLSSQILKLSGSLGEKEMQLRQEGGPGIDLNGNVVVSVQYELTDDWAKPVNFIKFEKLYDDGQKPRVIDSLKTSALTVIFPDLKQDITGRLDYDFLYRQVTAGNRHIPEARQKVKFWSGEVSADSNVVLKKKPVILVRKEDIRPKAYSLVVGASILYLKGKPMNFESADEALIFLHYLGALLQTRIPLMTGVTLNGTALNAATFDTLQIKTSQL